MNAAAAAAGIVRVQPTIPALPALNCMYPTVCPCRHRASKNSLSRFCQTTITTSASHYFFSKMLRHPVCEDTHEAIQVGSRKKPARASASIRIRLTYGGDRGGDPRRRENTIRPDSESESMCERVLVPLLRGSYDEWLLYAAPRR